MAKKLKALSERGEGGEKSNADRLLKDLMEKHGISFSDIEDEATEKRLFHFKAKQRKIFIQVAAMVIGKGVEFWGCKGKRNALFIDCTVAQFLEIQAAFDFYWEAYESELKLFDQAFIYKNHLVPHDAEVSDEEMNPEELEKLVNMMKGIDERTMQKQLSVGANIT